MLLEGIGLKSNLIQIYPGRNTVIKQEINLIKKLKHPLIIEGYKTFQDNKFLYSLVQFVRGEELYDVIREMGLLGT